MIYSLLPYTYMYVKRLFRTRERVDVEDKHLILIIYYGPPEVQRSVIWCSKCVAENILKFIIKISTTNSLFSSLWFVFDVNNQWWFIQQLYFFFGPFDAIVNMISCLICNVTWIIHNPGWTWTKRLTSIVSTDMHSEHIVLKFYLNPLKLFQLSFHNSNFVFDFLLHVMLVQYR